MRILANTTTLPLLAPVGAVVLAWAALSWFEPLPPSATQILATAPFLMFGIGAALSGYFKMSNATAQFGLLVGAQSVLAHAGGLSPAGAGQAIGRAELLIPVNSAAFGGTGKRAGRER